MEHHMQPLQQKMELLQKRKNLLQHINLSFNMCKLYEASMFDTFARFRSNTRRLVDADADGGLSGDTLHLIRGA